MKQPTHSGGRTEFIMKYTHIVFDVDGTLLDTAQCILEALKETLETVSGHAPEIDELRFALGLTSENVLRRLSVKEELIPSIIEMWVKKEADCLDLIRPFPGIEELVTNLKQAGAKLGIVTSRTRSELELVFRPFSLKNLFPVIICADDSPEHKPSPAPLLKYMEKAGAKPSEVLYVGDSAQDMECAKRAGTDSALAVWGTLDRKIEATYYPEHPSGLAPLIQPA